MEKERNFPRVARRFGNATEGVKHAMERLPETMG